MRRKISLWATTGNTANRNHKFRVSYTGWLTRLCLLAITGLYLTGLRHEALANPTPEYITDHIPRAETVGSGRLTYLFWDVYDAALHAPAGRWQPDRPFALTLTYLRHFDGEDIAERSIRELRGLGWRDPYKLTAWDNRMRQIFPDVQPGTSLTGIYLPDGNTLFYMNGQPIGGVGDPEFGRAFFAIWLDKNTSEPGLRRKLLGVDG